MTDSDRQRRLRSHRVTGGQCQAAVEADRVRVVAVDVGDLGVDIGDAGPAAVADAAESVGAAEKRPPPLHSRGHTEPVLVSTESRTEFYILSQQTHTKSNAPLPGHVSVCVMEWRIEAM